MRARADAEIDLFGFHGGFNVAGSSAEERAELNAESIRRVANRGVVVNASGEVISIEGINPVDPVDLPSSLNAPVGEKKSDNPKEDDPDVHILSASEKVKCSDEMYERVLAHLPVDEVVS